MLKHEENVKSNDGRFETLQKRPTCFETLKKMNSNFEYRYETLQKRPGRFKTLKKRWYL